MTRAFLRAIAVHPARDRIRVPGKQSRAAVAEAVASLSAFFFVMETGANTRSSTLPLALGSGVPVVATRGRDTDDVFQDGRNVLFADSFSGDAFAACVLRLQKDPSLAASLSGEPWRSTRVISPGRKSSMPCSLPDAFPLASSSPGARDPFAAPDPACDGGPAQPPCNAPWLP